MTTIQVNPTNLRLIHQEDALMERKICYIIKCALIEIFKKKKKALGCRVHLCRARKETTELLIRSLADNRNLYFHLPTATA